MATASHDLRSQSASEPKAREEVRSEQATKTGPAPIKPQQDEAERVSFQPIDLRATALVGLLILATIALLYFAKTLLLPIVSAFVLGSMLAPAASLMQRHHIPRPLAAVAIVLGTFGAFALIIGLISAPLLEWTSRLPELAALLKARAAVFDQQLAFLNDLRSYFGDGAPLQWPKIEWVQPTVEFLSPTFVELLLFFATLVLFIASWTDLRRALILMFADRDVRLRTLRMLNEIEDNLGSYLLTVTLINIGVGTGAGLICALTGMPNPVGLGALAATLNFIPIIGPIATFAVLLAVGLISFPDVVTGLLPPLVFGVIAFLEGHFITPTIIGRRLALNALAVFLALAFWSWLWGPIGAFLACPLLIVMLVVKHHLLPDDDPSLPNL